MKTCRLIGINVRSGSFWLCLLIVGVLFGVFLSPAQAVVDSLYRSSTYDLSFTDLTFADASALYAVDQLWGADEAGESTIVYFYFKTDYTDLTITTDPSITYSYIFTGPASIDETIEFNDGSDLDGHRYLTYRTPFTSEAQPSDASWITRNTAGPLYDLEFLGGGWQTGVGSGSQFDLIIHLPGDWSTPGTGTGQTEFLGINSDWTITQYFVYSPGDDMTIFTATNGSYVPDTSPDAHFILHGTQIPAPGAILLGGIGVGLVGWMRRRRTL